MSKAKVPIGQLLLRQGLIDGAQLQSALGRQRQFGGRLTSHIYAMKMLPEATLVRYLAQQVERPGIVLEQSVISLSSLRVVAYAICQRYMCLPVHVDRNWVWLAMSDPQDIAVLDEMRFATGKRVQPLLAIEYTLKDAIERGYADLAAGKHDVLLGAGVSPNMADEMREKLHIVGEEYMEATAPSNDRQPTATGTGPVPTVEQTVPLDSIDLDSTPEYRTYRLLIGEDNERIGRQLAKFFGDRGCEPRAVNNGADLLRALKETRPDLVVAEASLPGVTGVDLCRKMKASQTYRNTPVVLTSATLKGWRAAADLLDFSGADAFLAKPIDSARLRRTVGTLLDPDGVDDRFSARKRELEKAEQSYTAGLEAYREGDYDSALEWFSRGLSADPFSAKLRFQAGNALSMKGLTFQAICEYERVLDDEPEYFPALKNLAVLLERQGFMRTAVDIWERALRACTEPALKTKIRSHVQAHLDRLVP